MKHHELYRNKSRYVSRKRCSSPDIGDAAKASAHHWVVQRQCHMATAMNT